MRPLSHQVNVTVDTAKTPQPASESAAPRGIVQVQQVTKRFPGATRGSEVLALDGVSLGVREGEFVALLGPSGCGKTTLLRILSGQEVATAGRVTIDNQDMAGVPPERRPVNMVFQSPALFPHLTVYDNIAFGPRLARHSEPQIRQRVDEMLALVRLEGYQQRRVTQLSGGQAQRIALARALINRPRVLLLDEPLSALDLKLRKAMQFELKSIHRLLGTTFIYVTHDQEEAITMADRIVIMDRARIVQEGTPFEVYQRPTTVFASQFVGDSNVLPATVSGRDAGLLTVDMGGLRMRAEDAPTAQVGQSVWVSIRPERIVLDQPGDASAVNDDGSGNAFPATIVDAVFLGALLRYEVRVGQDLRLTVLEGFREDRPLLPPGASVVARWQPAHCLVLTA